MALFTPIIGAPTCYFSAFYFPGKMPAGNCLSSGTGTEPARLPRSLPIALLGPGHYLPNGPASIWGHF